MIALKSDSEVCTTWYVHSKFLALFTATLRSLRKWLTWCHRHSQNCKRCTPVHVYDPLYAQYFARLPDVANSQLRQFGRISNPLLSQDRHAFRTSRKGSILFINSALQGSSQSGRLITAMKLCCNLPRTNMNVDLGVHLPCFHDIIRNILRVNEANGICWLKHFRQIDFAFFF